MVNIEGILFDLDGTLLDSSKIEYLRDKRKWKDCVVNIHQTNVFEGIHDLLSHIKALNIKIGIVTSSVSFYAEAMLKFYKLPYDNLVAYHDVQKRKPHPEPYIRACTNLFLNQFNVVGVGDKIDDALSLSGANIVSIGAGWSNSFQQHSKWNHIINHPLELKEIIGI